MPKYRSIDWSTEVSADKPRYACARRIRTEDKVGLYLNRLSRECDTNRMQFTDNTEHTLGQRRTHINRVLGGAIKAVEGKSNVHCTVPARYMDGATKITTATKQAALEAASDFLNQGVPFV